MRRHALEPDHQTHLLQGPSNVRNDVYNHFSQADGREKLLHNYYSNPMAPIEANGLAFTEALQLDPEYERSPNGNL